MKWYTYLLIFVPLSIIAHTLHLNDGVVFLLSALSIVPLAVIIGDSTEQIALYSGPKVGGMLNATMGNIPELFIGAFAVKAGLFTLVMASMAGSIIGNILLVLGVSVFLGGLRYKQQTFIKDIARSNFTLLFFAATSIIIPYMFSHSGSESTVSRLDMQAFSIFIALLLLLLYILGLIFSLVTHKNIFVQHQIHEEEEEEKPKWSMRTAILVLTGSTFFVALASELLVGSVEKATEQWGLSEIFVGIILIPILGNVAEHTSAILMAMKNKVDISIEIAIGSSMQIALFVAPVLVVFSFLLGTPMNYIYTKFQVVSLLLGIIMALFVFQDGKTNWLEGAQLMALYVILATAFFLM